MRIARSKCLPMPWTRAGVRLIPEGHSVNRSLSAIEPVSATAKTEIRKWRVETGARNLPRKGRNTENYRPETGIRLFDDRGNRMSPTHANKRGVRYRYYVSHAILQNRKAEQATSPACRLPRLRPSCAKGSAGTLQQWVMASLRPLPRTAT
jgi:hypothetical protein